MSRFYTFVFTDIEGSSVMTRKLEAVVGKQEYERLRDKHRAILFPLVAQHDGTEASRAGDGSFFVFTDPHKALQAMIAFQQAMPIEETIAGESYTLTVRIGAHYCTSERVMVPGRLVNGAEVFEYSGSDTNFAARIGGLGSGGQLLVSESLAMQLWEKAFVRGFNNIEREDRAAPSGLSVRCWPSRYLKSFEDAPETVYEVLYRDNLPEREPGIRYFPEFYAGELNRYIERKERQEAVFAALKGNTTSAIVEAEGGMGKTRLAVACAARAAGVFPSGVFLVSLAVDPTNNQNITEDFVARRVLDALPPRKCEDWGLVVESSTTVPVQFVAERLRGRGVLLVLDNWESVSNAAGRALLRTLASNSVRTLLTSRVNPEVLGFGEVVSLHKGMMPDEARALFETRARERNGHAWAVAAEDEPFLERVLALTVCVPLAIELAAARTASRSLKKLAEELERAPLGPVLATKENWDDTFALDRHRSITRTLDWSWALLSESEKRVFAAACLFPGALDVDVLCHITGEDEETLYSLVNTSLVRTDDRKTRYTLHHLTRVYARLCLVGGEVWRDTQEKATLRDGHTDAERIRKAFVDHYNGCVQSWQDDTAKTADQFRYNPETNQEYVREKDNVIAAAHEAVALKYTESYVQISRFGWPLRQLGYWNDAENYFTLYVQAFNEANDTRNASWAMHQLAQIYANKGDWDGAIRVYEQNIEITKAIDDREGEAATLHGLGNIYTKKGDWDGAIRVYKQSLEIQRAIGNRQGEAATLHGLGNIYVNKGDWDGAIRVYKQSLEIQRAIGNRQGEAATLHGLGNIYVNKGDWDGAIRVYKQSLEIQRAIGNRQGEAATLHGLGNIYTKKGDWDDAIRVYEQAQGIYRELGYRQGEAATLHGLGNIYTNKGDWDGAIRVYEQAIKIDRAIGDRQGEAITIASLGNIYKAAGKIEKAIESYRLGRDKLIDLGDVFVAGQVGIELAQTFAEAGRKTEARDAAHEAVAAFAKMQHTQGVQQAQTLLMQIEKGLN